MSNNPSEITVNGIPLLGYLNSKNKKNKSKDIKETFTNTTLLPLYKKPTTKVITEKQKVMHVRIFSKEKIRMIQNEMNRDKLKEILSNQTTAVSKVLCIMFFGGIISTNIIYELLENKYSKRSISNIISKAYRVFDDFDKLTLGNNKKAGFSYEWTGSNMPVKEIVSKYNAGRNKKIKKILPNKSINTKESLVISILFSGRTVTCNDIFTELAATVGKSSISAIVSTAYKAYSAKLERCLPIGQSRGFAYTWTGGKLTNTDEVINTLKTVYKNSPNETNKQIESNKIVTTQKKKFKVKQPKKVKIFDTFSAARCLFQEAKKEGLKITLHIDSNTV